MTLREHVEGFMNFVRTQGVVGLVVGFILGGAVTKVVTALVNDIINPLLSIILGSTENLKASKFVFGKVEVLWGDFLSTGIDFLIIALVVYYGVTLLGINKKEKK